MHAAAAAASDAVPGLGHQNRNYRLTTDRRVHHCSAVRNPYPCLRRCPHLGPRKAPSLRPATRRIKLYTLVCCSNTECMDLHNMVLLCLGQSTTVRRSLACPALTPRARCHAGPPHRPPHFHCSHREEARRQERPCGVIVGPLVAAASALPRQSCRVHHRPPRLQTTTWQPWVPAAAEEALQVGRDLPCIHLHSGTPKLTA